MNQAVPAKPRRQMKPSANKAEPKDKKEKKQKKAKKVKSILECYLPAPERIGKTTAAFGYGMRALLSGLLSAAFANFLCDSFDIIALPRLLVFLTALIIAGIFALMTRSKMWFGIGFGVLLLGVGVVFLVSGNPAAVAAGMVPQAWNTAMKALDNAGYQTLGLLPVQAAGVDQAYYLIAFQIVLQLAITTLVFWSVYRKVRLLPLVLCGVFTMLPVFTYNFAYSAIEFAVIILSISGILVLRYYDRLLKNEKSVGKHKAALGGYMGFGAALLAAVAVLIPAMTVRDQWEEIRGLNETMEVARTVLSAVLVGEKPDWSQIDSSGNMDSLGARSTLATHRTYTGKAVLDVYAGISSPLYLRSWVGYHYDDDTWKTGNDSQQGVYHDLFGDSFDPEVITQRFFEIADSELMQYDLNRDYMEHMDYGFISTLVSIDVLNSSGNLLYIPARFDTTHGFYGFEGDKNAARKPYGEATNRYFDGVVTTGWLNLNKQYSTIAHLPVYREPYVAENLQALKNDYNAVMAAISRYYNDASRDPTLTFESFRNAHPEYMVEGVDYSLLQAFASMSKHNQAVFYEQYVTLPAIYERYVDNHYTTTLGSDRVSSLAHTLLNDHVLPKLYSSSDSDSVIWLDSVLTERPISSRVPIGNVVATHTAVMEVIAYLRENCTYTLTPKQSTGNIANRGYNSVETFLFLTGEGYCVQYATAATFLLREMGIPVRYVEGYMVDSLDYDDDYDNRFQKYHTTVRDFNAHAWIEVYYDDIGWLTYEVTAPYYEKMYQPHISSPIIPDDVPDPPQTTPLETLPADPNEPTPSVPLILGFMTVEQATIAGIGVGALLVALAVTLLLRRLLRKRKLRLKTRHEKVMRALNGNLTQTEIRELGVYIAGLISTACIAGGMERSPKEYPLDYAKRIDEALASLKDVPVIRYNFAQIVPLMEKVYFGKELERQELTVLAEFWISLREKILERYNPFEKCWYVTIREMV